MATVDDIRVPVSWRTHPKRAFLEAELGKEGVCTMVDLWIFCGMARTNGDLSGMSDRAIEVAAGWVGESGLFVKTVVEIGLIDGKTEKSRRIHDWSDHNPWAANADMRSRKATGAASARWGNGVKPVRLNGHQDDDKSSDVSRIYEHYVQLFPKRRGQAGHANTRDLIRERLDHHTADDLVDAINSCCADEWHSKNGQTGLPYIMRDDETIDKFLAKANPEESVAKVDSAAIDAEKARREALEIFGDE